MNRLNNIKYLSLLSGIFVSVSGVSIAGIANAASPSTSISTTSCKSTSLSNIINKGDSEITRRINSLNQASGKISSTTKLSASDKAYLTSEVGGEISGLNSLKTTLDAETTCKAATNDVQNIYSDYRVYALLLPKVWLVSAADSQQTTERKLTSTAQSLQARITTAQKTGKNVTALQNELNDMTTQTNNGQAISSNIESAVLTLQPSDYNSNHSVLSGDSAQLKTAQSDLQTAYKDANNIVSGLKNL